MSSLSQENNYAVTLIPEALLRDANAVVRNHIKEVSIIAVDKMVVYEKKVVTVLNKSGNIDAFIGESYDDYKKITKLSAKIYDAMGNQIKKYKSRNFEDESAVDGETLYSDSRLKYIDYTPVSYPYTLVFESEYKTYSTGFIPVWFPINGYYISVEKASYSLINPERIPWRSKEINFENFAIEKEKVGTIFQFVKSKVKWNEFTGKYTDKGVKKAYKEGVGNVADINLMLTSMFRYAGLNASPVLVSTRSNGIPLFPTLSGFNHVITMVEFADGTYALLDATEPYSLPNILPIRAMNWNGRKVSKNGVSSWVKLTSSMLATEDAHLSVKISKDMEMEGLLRIKYGNLNALNYRRRNNHLKDEIVQTRLEEQYQIEIDNFKIVNQYKITKPISLIAKFRSEDFIEEINDKLYIYPLLFFARKKNPFKLEDRKFPVDFATPSELNHSVSIEIPEGYKVSSLPAAMAIGLPNNLGVFKYQIHQVGSKINVRSILQFYQALISAKNYQVLKLFYGDLVKKQSEKMILVKQ